MSYYHICYMQDYGILDDALPSLVNLLCRLRLPSWAISGLSKFAMDSGRPQRQLHNELPPGSGRAAGEPWVSRGIAPGGPRETRESRGRAPGDPRESPGRAAGDHKRPGRGAGEQAEPGEPWESRGRPGTVGDGPGCVVCAPHQPAGSEQAPAYNMNCRHARLPNESPPCPPI
jgi:hypothetical protein